MSKYHQYIAACTKAQYEEYGQIESLLLLRGIKSVGVEYKSGFKDDGKTYYHMLLVMSTNPLSSDLFEMFPGITTPWTHEEHDSDSKSGKSMPKNIKTKLENGKLIYGTDKFSFRI